MQHESGSNQAVGIGMTERRISSLLKGSLSLFIAILIPSYWMQYGPSNFLWFSDVALFLTYLAVVFENSLFAGMAAIGGLLLEVLWIIDFFGFLLFGIRITGLTDYMFDSQISMWIRGLSLFHIPLPFFLLWLIARLGYERKALIYQTFLAWGVILVTWLVTDPKENINWVFSYQDFQISPILYLCVEGVLVSLIYFVTHQFLKWFSLLQQRKMS